MTKRKAYWEKLRDPRWQKKRLEIMEAADFACQKCEATNKTLNVHHRIYRKGADPWDYEAHELDCLCEDCHEQLTGTRAALDEVIAILPDDFLERILGYAQANLALYEIGTSAKTPISITTEAQADGALDVLWKQNIDNDRPAAGCLCDHGNLNNDLLLYALGIGEMPPPFDDSHRASTVRAPD